MASSDIVCKDWNLFANLHNFLKDPKFADLEIKCGDRTFKVHSIIMVQKCPYYATLLKTDWTKDKVLSSDLSDDEAAVVARAINFIYSGRYPEHDLTTTGVRQFQDIKDIFGTRATAPLLHAKMYAIGSKLMIPELLTTAKEAFKASYSHGTSATCDGWVELVHFIYNSTKESHGHLRQLVLQGVKYVLAYDASLTQKTDLNAVFAAVPQLAVDVATTQITSQNALFCTRCDTNQSPVYGRCSHDFVANCGRCVRAEAQVTECLHCDGVGLECQPFVWENMLQDVRRGAGPLHGPRSKSCSMTRGNCSVTFGNASVLVKSKLAGYAGPSNGQISVGRA